MSGPDPPVRRRGLPECMDGHFTTRRGSDGRGGALGAESGRGCLTSARRSVPYRAHFAVRVPREARDPGVPLVPRAAWPKASVAQLVEHLICNQVVVGSTPTAGSTCTQAELTRSARSPRASRFAPSKRDHVEDDRERAAPPAGHRSGRWSRACVRTDIEHHAGRFPSGQRGQTVNLMALPSAVRIRLSPPDSRPARSKPTSPRSRSSPTGEPARAGPDVPDASSDASRPSRTRAPWAYPRA